MKRECNGERSGCNPLGRREVVGRFDGGAPVLRELEARLGIIRRFAECSADHRDERDRGHAG
ncbi:MAG: hypothetical protein ACYSU0_05890 [Planctomycetota bacterium]